MSAILKLVQGTAAWHEHRAKSRNASETPVVLGVSPFQTPYQLWCIRTGRAEQRVTPAMERGASLEGAARAAYEKQTGLVLEPLVLQEGAYSASLDGITLAGDLILEIKCPYKGKASEVWQAIAAGQVPEYYWWQVQHQLMVSKAAVAHVFVFHTDPGTHHRAAARVGWVGCCRLGQSRNSVGGTPQVCVDSCGGGCRCRSAVITLVSRRPFSRENLSTDEKAVDRS